MARDRIKGITVEIGGDTGGLSKALSGVNRDINATQSSLKDVQRLLKLDPKNTKLLAQQQRLLTKEVDDTRSKLHTLKEAEKQAQQQFKEGRISQDQYEGLQREIADTERKLGDLKEAASKSNAAMSYISQTASEISNTTGKMAEKTAALSAAAGGVLGAAGGAFIAYQDSFAKVSTLLDNSTTDFDAYSKSIIDGSSEAKVAVDEFSEAVYQAMSASVDQADAVQFVADAAKLAKGGFTELTTAVDVETTVLNAYKKKAEEAAHVGDVLVATQNAGKTSVGELAASMGPVIPVAAAANTSFEQLAASYALMTKNGIPTAQAGTMVKAMLGELSKTGSLTDKAMREMAGKGFAELQDEGKSLGDVLAMMDDYAKKNNKTLKDMFGSAEAGTAALTLGAKEGADFNEMLTTVSDSAGSVDAAFEKVSSTAGERMKASMNEMKNTGIELGEQLAPTIDMITDIIERVTAALSGMDEEQLKTVAGVLMVVAALSPLLAALSKVFGGISWIFGTGIPKLTLAFETLTTTVLPAIGSAFSSVFGFIVANPIVLLIAAIIGMVALIVTQGDKIVDLLEMVDNFLQGVFAKDWTTVFGPVLGNALNAFFANVKNIWDAVKTISLGIITFIQGVFSGNWKKAWEGIVQIFEGVFDGIKAAAKIPLNAVIGLVNTAISGVNGVLGQINKIPGVDLPTVGKIPYLADGGILERGSAVVGEAGPELLTMDGGRAVVRPLTNNTTNHNVGGIVVNVYAARGQSERGVADLVLSRLHHEMREQELSLS